MGEKSKVVTDGKTVYLPDAGALAKVPVAAAKTTASTSAPLKDFTVNKKEIALWGTDNLFPQNILKLCRKNTIVPTTLNKMAKVLYGNGLQVGRVKEYDKDGNEVFIPEPNYKPWKEFSKRSNVNRYLMQASNDLYWFYNLFPEMVLTNDRSEIYSLKCQKAPYARFSKQNTNGEIESCFLNGNWDQFAGSEDKETITIPVIDPFNDPVTVTKGRSDGFRYIYPCSYPSPDETFYQLAHWDSLRTSGWLEYMNSIPEIKKRASENILVINYIIEVADWYWTWKYPDWDEKPDLQETRVTDSYQAFNDFVAGKENSGKTLFLPKKTDPSTYQGYPGWEIKPVDKSKIDGVLNQDSGEAGSHLLYALGWDPTLSGMKPGKEMGAGSGSDKRVAMNIYVSMCQAERDIILEPFYFIKNYNGWDDEIEFRLKYPMITTLDKGKEVQQQSS